MRFLHTMIRSTNLLETLNFFIGSLGLVEVNRYESETGRFTLVFLSAPSDEARALDERSPLIEITYNWDSENLGGGRNFGHLAFEVDNIYEICEQLSGNGICINRPPRDGRMAFVISPDGISVELLQEGEALAPKEPWISMPNTGSW